MRGKQIKQVAKTVIENMGNNIKIIHRLKTNQNGKSTFTESSSESIKAFVKHVNSFKVDNILYFKTDLVLFLPEKTFGENDLFEIDGQRYYIQEVNKAQISNDEVAYYNVVVRLA